MIGSLSAAMAAVNLATYRARYTMDEELKLFKRLDELRIRHRELDEQIKGLDNSPMNQLLLMRLKKEKLTLRDEITQIERILYPDIIA